MSRCAWPLVILFLAACAAQPPAPVDHRAEGSRQVSERVRQPAGETPGLQVYPLRNPAVGELTEKARAAEARGDLDAANRLLERALRIESRDPELLQYMAEIQLARGRPDQAESYAARSFELGPRVGELCVRNWRTLSVAREEQGNDAGANDALDRAENCRVERPPRY